MVGVLSILWLFCFAFCFVFKNTVLTLGTGAVLLIGPFSFFWVAALSGLDVMVCAGSCVSFLCYGMFCGTYVHWRPALLWFLWWKGRETAGGGGRRGNCSQNIWESKKKKKYCSEKWPTASLIATHTHGVGGGEVNSWTLIGKSYLTTIVSASSAFHLRAKVKVPSALLCF